MEGINILATITHDTVNSSFFLFLILTFVFVVLTCMYCNKYSFLCGFLALLSFSSIFFFSIEQEVTYKATIDDTVTVQALEEKYIIVDKVDDLYTLKLKENEDE